MKEIYREDEWWGGMNDINKPNYTMLHAEHVVDNKLPANWKSEIMLKTHQPKLWIESTDSAMLLPNIGDICTIG